MKYNTYSPESAAKYRKCDETETESFAHFADRVSNISVSVPGARVLDVGCGTGRYFRYVKYAASILGVDPSGDMIKEARNPAGDSDCEIAYNAVDPFEYPEACGENYFDFIYSIGVLGEHIRFGMFEIDQMYKWLASGGVLFFTIVDKAAKPAKIEALHEHELARIMMRSQFNKFHITHQAIDSPMWKGAHHLVEAIK